MSDTHQLLAAVAIVAIVLLLNKAQESRRDSRHGAFWTAIPQVGVSSGRLLPWVHASLCSLYSSAETTAAGYEMFCKKQDKPFAMAHAAAGAIIVLPPSRLPVISLSDDKILALAAQNDTLQPRWTGGGRAHLYQHPVLHFDVVRKHMMRDVSDFAAATDEELRMALRSCWGPRSPNEDWRTVDVWDTCSRIISRAANRCFVGLPLCRDETLLEQSRSYANAVYIGAGLITALPGFMRPIAGSLVALAAKRYLTGSMKILVPFVEERLRLWHDGGGKDMPNDALQWMIERCSKAGPGEMAPECIAQRLLILNLVSIYTTTYAFSNCMLDLYSSPERDEFVAGLRAECTQIAGESQGGFPKADAVKRLYRVDSLVRESLRVSAFGIVALPRIVAPGEGLDLGFDGLPSVPAGTRLGIPLRPIHMDTANYHDPMRFDAFRFSREFENCEGITRQATEQKLSVDVSETFLTYGFGKHACPGRWFASQIIKQAVAHMVQEYDVECVGKPEKKTLLNMVMPPMNNKVRIRLRDRSYYDGMNVGSFNL
ncbi:hypothetical protein DL765_004181 [Monosporascus sp. GIB2]|nr:hypothetical protein DL765_004181 [Monosporascus sp. GIB2]